VEIPRFNLQISLVERLNLREEVCHFTFGGFCFF